MGANAQTSVPTFTTGQVLTAAQQNQSARTGVPVFASTGDRDAAFGGTGEKTLAEGQLCYVEGTGLQTYNSGGSWVTWGAAPASGALQFIAASGAQSTVSNIAFNNCFSATYSNYRIIIENLIQSAAANMQFRLRVGGVDTAGTGYHTTRIECNNVPTISGISVATTSSWAPSYVANSTDGTSLVIDVFRPFAVVATMATAQAARTDSTTSLITSTSSHYHNTATSFDGFNIVPASGTVTCNNIRVYGYANS
jgi:hypothetical protein